MEKNQSATASKPPQPPLVLSRAGFSVNALLKEAMAIATFAERHWHATDDLPGLSSAGKRLERGFIDQLHSLIESLREVQTRYSTLSEAKTVSSDTLAEARLALQELNAFVAWYQETEEDNVGILHSIARVEAASINDLDSPHALAYALYNYATVAADIIDINGPAGGIDRDTIESALALVSALVDAGHPRTRASEEVLSLAALRRRLTFLLHKKVDYLGSTIRFVFRHHSSILADAPIAPAGAPKVSSFQAHRASCGGTIGRTGQIGRTGRTVLKVL